MSKTKMLCPFSDKLCKECPLFIGKHYHLCHKTKYRGYLGNEKKETEEIGLRGEQGFEMPLHLTINPGWLTADKVTERTFDT
ncbi:MAG: hypothetical protein KJ607_04985 [Bacteroidetes bacterium]|nr:hypothetical protein [Bacteroidota bacterium]